MRVAIVKSNGYIDNRISRVLGNEGINGDIIVKFTRNTANEYDSVIFTYQNNVPNMPKLLERIVLENNIHVVYITNTPSIGQFYNLFEDLHFNHINEQNLDLILCTMLRHTKKYLKIVHNQNEDIQRLKDDVKLLKLINKAKRVLMNKGLNEADSHKFIISKSMEMRVSKLTLANLIIEEKIDL